jgi:progesterone-induced-blocking factor 1
MSDSDMDSEGMRGSVSLSDVESSANPLNPSRTQPKFPRQQNFNAPEPVEVRNNYQSIINMLEKQNAFLTAEVKRVAAAGEAEKQRIMSNNRIEVDRLLSEVRALKTKLAY